MKIILEPMAGNDKANIIIRNADGAVFGMTYIDTFWAKGEKNEIHDSLSRGYKITVTMMMEGSSERD